MQSAHSLRKPVLGASTATGTLKLIALVFMMTDHMGKMLFPDVPEMRMLGRIAFPLYAWCLVVGFCYTRNVWRYALRLLAVGLISQPLYMAALAHTWREPNIFLTLLLGLLALVAVAEKPWERMSPAARALGRLAAGVGLALRPEGAAAVLLSPWLRLQALAVLALPLMLFPWKQNARLPAWAGYGLYPAHLAVLWLLERI